jgi:general secretion pathway protein I
MSSTRKRRGSAGFTLLEVMVAVAILAISLSAAFSTEAGAIRMAARARKMGHATLLARCKMGELEETLAKEGLPATLSSGSDDCCEDAEIDGYTCDWEIEPVLMPDTMFAPTDEAALGDDAQGVAPGEPAAVGAAKAQDLVGGGAESLMSGGADIGGIAAMAMQFVYPTLKASFESQIRRATVTVSWREGDNTRSFDVTQYIVAEQAVMPDAAGGATESGTDGTGVAPGTSPPGATNLFEGRR